MAIKKHLLSPRQKMINLMYVVLMAMLALNVSSEVLNGFDIVEDGLERSLANAEAENKALYEDIKKQWQLNPAKAMTWYDKAGEVRVASDSLCLFAEGLKKDIIRQANGNNETDTLQHKDDLEAAAQVMLAPGSGKGGRLGMAISDYRNRMVALIGDDAKKNAVMKALATDVPKNAGNKQWKEYMFESMPAAAAVTMLTKLQSDIRYVEGEVLHNLYANIDAGDTRVNKLEALVIPEARTVVRGNRFSAKVVMAAVDTTQVPEIFVQGRKTKLTDGFYVTTCDRTGDFSFAGWLETKAADGQPVRKMFRQDYTVVEPTATIAAELMNVLYAGYDNPVSVSVPGVPLSSISATMTGGTLKQTAPGRYIAKPTKVGQDAVITVHSNSNGQNLQMAQYAFKVRKLPEPAPFVNVTDDKGNPERYSGGTLTKAKLMAATGVSAAVDDGILHIPFRVLSFELVVFDNMGNAVPVASDGANFSAQQKGYIKKLYRGKRLYITRLTAIGPDGIERKLNASMEVIIR